jgi:hypothetical protein
MMKIYASCTVALSLARSVVYKHNMFIIQAVNYSKL